MELLEMMLAGGVVVAIVEFAKSVVMWGLNKKSVSLKSIAETAELLRESQLCIMYNQIKTLCKRHCAEGEITSDELEDLIAMHEVYHKLGGNGYLDEYMQHIKGLKIV